jgi:hypothetical protein
MVEHLPSKQEALGTNPMLTGEGEGGGGGEEGEGEGRNP